MCILQSLCCDYTKSVLENHVLVLLAKKTAASKLRINARVDLIIEEMQHDKRIT